MGQRLKGTETMNPNAKKSLERMLESAVVVHWADLMRSTQAGLVHIQYGFAAGGTLDYVQVWSSITPGQMAPGLCLLDVSVQFMAWESTSIMDINQKVLRTLWRP
jgi:phosphodiesterase/alkaline phosphatase D-like protein